MERDGLVTIASSHTPAVTIDRLMSALDGTGITVFACIDHAAGAASAGMSLRPTTVVIFGNPAAGTPLMQSDQRIGLDLPLKALVWEDADGRTWLTYTDPAWLAERYGLGDAAKPVAARLAAGLAGLAAAATGPLNAATAATAATGACGSDGRARAATGAPGSDGALRQRRAPRAARRGAAAATGAPGSDGALRQRRAPERAVQAGPITSAPAMYGHSTSGIRIEPSAC